MIQQIKTSIFFLVVSGLLFFCSCSATNIQPDSRLTNSPNYSFIGSEGNTSGPLSIKSIELAFENGQGDITLAEKSRPNPQAIISFNGNGLFQAQWQVDGRVLEQVSLNVVFGKTLKLNQLATTQFPIFEPGPHEITLKIINPISSLTSPVISYFIQLQ